MEIAEKYYTNEVDVQIVIQSLKNHMIRRVVVSPGSTNHTFVLSIQRDPFFVLYSCVDERSAAYMACGIAAETGEPVVLSCTAATASRNYFPALTEAYYRKLPILAITSTRTQCQVGNLIDQQIDRSVQPNDTVKLSVQLPFVKDEEDFWECELKVNRAILELNHRGKGPVHINMPTRYDHGYDCKELPYVRCIKRYVNEDILPLLPSNSKIGVYIGSHETISEELTDLIDKFCEVNNAAVFCEHTSGYYGKYAIYYYQALSQQMPVLKELMPDLVIDLGEIASLIRIQSTKRWRLSEDGELRDPYKNLENVFEMTDSQFFKYYSKGEKKDCSYFYALKDCVDRVSEKKVTLPFSNVYVASQLHDKIPSNSVIHFGILNSSRSWNLFELPKTVKGYCNVGGYGIDGGVSSLIGASLVHPEKLYFGVFGDLCFFYDMNSIGNRHISNNLRIILINNGLGEEFKTFFGHTAQWGDEVNEFVAAEGHYGKKSLSLVRNYVENLGFEYICASSETEFEQVYKTFINPELTAKPVFFEIFTTDKDENEALKLMMSKFETVAGHSKDIAKKILGENGVKIVKGMLGRK